MDFNLDIEKRKEATLAKLVNFKNLPSIPKVLFEVTKLLNSPSATTLKLAELISKDQGLTTKILAVANSPLYGIKRKVSSIEFAIIVLGQQEIKDVVTAISLADSFKITPSPNFDPIEFWVHSMVTGTAAKNISQNLGFSFGSDAFVAGILHDMGILVIYNFMQDDFNKIAAITKEKNISIIDAEKEVLGLTHQEIGKFLAERWNLPVQLCDTLNFHHAPSKAQFKELTAIIHLVDYMTQKLGYGKLLWDEGSELDQEVLDILRFKSSEDFDNFIADYKELFELTASSIRF